MSDDWLIYLLRVWVHARKIHNRGNLFTKKMMEKYSSRRRDVLRDIHWRAL